MLIKIKRLYCEVEKKISIGKNPETYIGFSDIFIDPNEISAIVEMIYWHFDLSYAEKIAQDYAKDHQLKIYKITQKCGEVLTSIVLSDKELKLLCK